MPVYFYTGVSENSHRRHRFGTSTEPEPSNLKFAVRGEDSPLDE